MTQEFRLALVEGLPAPEPLDTSAPTDQYGTLKHGPPEDRNIGTNGSANQGNLNFH
jgi:hypothetical protein